MKFNQSQVRDLVIKDVATAKTRPCLGKVCFILEKKALYQGVDDNTLVADDESIITSSVTDQYWVKTSADAVMPSVGDAGAPAAGEVAVIGQPIPFSNVEGKDIADVLTDLMFPATVSVTQPTQTISSPTTGFVKAGSEFNTLIQFSEEVGDSGGFSGDATLTFTPSGGAAVVTTPFNTNTVYNPTERLAVGPNTFKIEKDCLQGAVPTDSRGNNRPELRIQAGTIESEVVTLTGVFYSHYGFINKGDAFADGTAADNRTLLDTLASEEAGAKTSFSNVSIANTQDMIIAVPGTFTNLTAMRGGFLTDIATVEHSAFTANDYGTGAETETYTVFRVSGQADLTILDSIVIS